MGICEEELKSHLNIRGAEYRNKSVKMTRATNSFR